MVFVFVFMIYDGVVGMEMFVEFDGVVLMDVEMVCCFVGVVFGWIWLFMYLISGVMFVVDCYCFSEELCWYF